MKAALNANTSKLQDKNRESDDSSYEDESISDDDESYISYYSVDQLSVIIEETEQDLLEEMSIRGSRSCRGNLRSRKSFDDIPPSPPVRKWSEDHHQLLQSSESTSSNSSRSGNRSERTSSTADTTLSSDSVLSKNGFQPPLTSSGGHLRDLRSDEESLDDGSACWSAPLNDVENEDSPAIRDERKFDLRHLEGKSESLQQEELPLVSFQLGEGIFHSSQSDDEYTFVSCTTGDDISLVSDLGSSQHNRTHFSMDDLDDDDIEQINDHQRSLSKISDAGLSKRRGSDFSMEGDGLLPIPEGDSSDEDNDAICQQPLNYEQIQKKLHSQIHSSSRLQEVGELSSKCPSSNRLIALKRRLQLERYSGVRRRRTFERAKNMLRKKLGSVKKMDHSNHSFKRGDIETQPIHDKLARFGGLTRSESFKRNKTEFEKKFDREVKPITKPLQRRRSLSPIRRKSSFDKADFTLRMSKSEGQLMVDIKTMLEELEEETNEKYHDDQAWDRNFEQQLKQRQESLGGNRRRNGFNRSRRFLTRKLEKIQARSKEEMERFGGLHRMASYKQSRELFQNPAVGGRNSLSLSEAQERHHDTCVASNSSDYEKLREFLPKAFQNVETSPAWGRSRKNFQQALDNQSYSLRELGL